MTDQEVLSAYFQTMGKAITEYPAWTMKAVRNVAVPLDVAPEAVEVWRLVQLRTAVERDLSDAVSKLRRAGVPWADLGVALGVSPQAAQQRYRSVAPVVRKREGAGA